MADGPIYIVSPRKFENELLSTFLAQKTGSQCVCRERIEHVPCVQNEDNNDGPPKLILLDCLGELPEKIVEQLESTDEETFSRCPLSLFRLRRDSDIEIKAMQQGVSGFFYEYDTPEHFLKGVHALCSGELWISREILRNYVYATNNKMQEHRRQNLAALLTRRELEILALLGSGASNDEIAEQLSISPHTVKTHIYNIFKKINVPNRLQATLWAADNLYSFNGISLHSPAITLPSHAPSSIGYHFTITPPRPV